MARRCLLLLLLAVTLAVHARAAVGGEDDELELELELELAGLLDGGAGTRRWLQDLGNDTAAGNDTQADSNNTAGYISYRALYPDTVPCSRPGASYYNCRAGAEANPYNRGCSAIAGCRN